MPARRRSISLGHALGLPVVAVVVSGAGSASRSSQAGDKLGPRDPVDRRVVHLHDDRLQPSFEALHEVQLPQEDAGGPSGSPTIWPTKSSSSDRPAGRGQARPAHVVVEVEVRVLDPHRVARVRNGTSTSRRRNGAARLRRRATMACTWAKEKPPGAARGIKEEDAGHVHVIGRRLHVQEHGVDPAQPLHLTSTFSDLFPGRSSAAVAEASLRHVRSSRDGPPPRNGPPPPGRSPTVRSGLRDGPRRASGIGVHKYDRYLTPVTRVDEARRVEAGDRRAGREPASRPARSRHSPRGSRGRSRSGSSHARRPARARRRLWRPGRNRRHRGAHSSARGGRTSRRTSGISSTTAHRS